MRCWKLPIHSPERRKEKAKGEWDCSMRPVSISGVLEACIDGIAVVSGKLETARDWRLRPIFVQRLLVSGAI